MKQYRRLIVVIVIFLAVVALIVISLGNLMYEHKGASAPAIADLAAMQTAQSKQVSSMAADVASLKSTLTGMVTSVNTAIQAANNNEANLAKQVASLAQQTTNFVNHVNNVATTVNSLSSQIGNMASTDSLVGLQNNLKSLGSQLDSINVVMGNLQGQMKTLSTSVNALEKVVSGNLGGNIRLLGMGDASSSTAVGGNYFALTRFITSTPGTVVYIRLKCLTTGEVKVALYNDNSGEPGSLMASNDIGIGVTAGWNTLVVPGMNIESGKAYWLATNASSSVVCYVASGAGSSKYRVATYNGFIFPDSAGSGFTSGSWSQLIAGWAD